MGTTTPTPALPSSPPVPAPSQISLVYGQSQPCAASAQLYSCGIQQRHRPTPPYNARYPPATCENDHHGPPCRSSGRRGRRFRSYNSTAGTTSRRPSPAADVADVAVSGLWDGWDTLSTLSYLVSVQPFRKSAAIRALTAGQAFSPS
jgi:hypothetical protein